MPIRKTVIATGEVYHVFNRSVGSIPIFNTQREYQRFYDLMNFYRFDHPQNRFSHYNRLNNNAKDNFYNLLLRNHHQLVNIFAYAFMPNHFHILLQQINDYGIQLLLKNLQNSYARYFNVKSKRFGSLFQSMFKCVRIEDDNQLLHVSRYIHLNPVTGFVIKDYQDLINYPWTSYPVYLGKTNPNFIEKEQILSNFKSLSSFEEYNSDQADYQRTLIINSHLYHDPEVSS
jgi:putative transposase